MSVGSSAELIPFTRFLEFRQRRHRSAAATGAVVMPASADVGSRLDVTVPANADPGVSPFNASATVHAAAPHGDTGMV
jgi:hypothetical protein